MTDRNPGGLCSTCLNVGFCVHLEARGRPRGQPRGAALYAAAALHHEGAAADGLARHRADHRATGVESEADARAQDVAFQSIRVRFFRSLVTTTSLVLAVAFLCYMRSSNDFAQALLNSGDINSYQILVKAGYDVSFDTEVIAAWAKQRWIVTLPLLV